MDTVTLPQQSRSFPLPQADLEQLGFRKNQIDRLLAEAQRFEIGLGQWKICDSLGADGGSDVHDAGSSCGDHIMVQWHVDDLRIDILCFQKTLPQCAPC